MLIHTLNLECGLHGGSWSSLSSTYVSDLTQKAFLLLIYGSFQRPFLKLPLALCWLRNRHCEASLDYRHISESDEGDDQPSCMQISQRIVESGRELKEYEKWNSVWIVVLEVQNVITKEIQNPLHHFGINGVNWYLYTHRHLLLYKSINKIVLSADEEQHWPIKSELILWDNENRVWFLYVLYKSE